MMSTKIDNNLIRCYDGSKISDKEIAAVWGDGAENQPSQPTAQPRGWECTLDKNAMAEPTEPMRRAAKTAEDVSKEIPVRYWQLSIEIAWAETAKALESCEAGNIEAQKKVVRTELLDIDYLNSFPWFESGLLQRLHNRLLGLLCALPTIDKAAAQGGTLSGWEDVVAMTKEQTAWAKAWQLAQKLGTYTFWFKFRSPANALQVRNRLKGVFQALSAELGHEVRYIEVAPLNNAQNEPPAALCMIVNVDERPKEDEKRKTALIEQIFAGEVTYSDILELRYCTAAALVRWDRDLRHACELRQQQCANRLNRAFDGGEARRISILIIADPRTQGDTSEVGKSYLMRRLTNVLCSGSIKLHKGDAGADPLDRYEGQAILQIDEHTGCNMSADYLKKLLDPENAAPMKSKYYHKSNLALVNFLVSCQPLDAIDGLEGYRANISQCFSRQAVWQFWRRITYVIRINKTEDGERKYSVDMPSKGGIFGVSFEPTELQDVTLDTLLQSRIMTECRAVLNKVTIN